MAGETYFDNQSPYIHDAVGELCDEWVGSGSAFVMHADGTYERDRAELYQDRELSFPEHNPDFVREIADTRGQPTACITAESYQYRGRIEPLLRRVMADLPLDHVVYSPNPTPEWQRHHPGKVEPLGIKLASLPEVQEVVGTARTRLPQGAKRYASGALVLYPHDKQALLTFFHTVLTPPAPAVAEPLALELQKPAQPTAPSTPKPQLAPRVPSKLPSWLNKLLDQAGRIPDRVLEPASYGFAVVAGVTGTLAVEAAVDERAYGLVSGLWTFVAVVAGIETVLTYLELKEGRKSGG